MLAGEGVALDQAEFFDRTKTPAKHLGEAGIDFDGQHGCAGGEQLFGQRAGAGANFDDEIRWLNLPRFGDEADEVAVDHEILTEAMARLHHRFRTGEPGFPASSVPFLRLSGGRSRGRVCC